MDDTLGFKIYITQKCFMEKRWIHGGELCERLEDAIADLLAEYGLEGRIFSDLTGNTTVFPIDRDEIERDTGYVRK